MSERGIWVAVLTQFIRTMGEGLPGRARASLIYTTLEYTETYISYLDNQHGALARTSLWVDLLLYLGWLFAPTKTGNCCQT